MRLVFVRWKILKLTRRVFPSERKRGMLMLVRFESMEVLLVESSRANEDRVSRWETETVVRYRVLNVVHMHRRYIFN